MMPKRSILTLGAEQTAHQLKRHPMGAFLVGRSERIRTSGPYVPNVVLYQAELHSECVYARLPREAYFIRTVRRAPDAPHTSPW